MTVHRRLSLPLGSHRRAGGVLARLRGQHLIGLPWLDLAAEDLGGVVTGHRVSGLELDELRPFVVATRLLPERAASMETAPLRWVCR